MIDEFVKRQFLTAVRQLVFRTGCGYYTVVALQGSYKATGMTLSHQNIDIPGITCTQPLVQFAGIELLLIPQTDIRLLGLGIVTAVVDDIKQEVVFVRQLCAQAFENILDILFCGCVFYVSNAVIIKVKRGRYIFTIVVFHIFGGVCTVGHYNLYIVLGYVVAVSQGLIDKGTVVPITLLVGFHIEASAEDYRIGVAGKAVLFTGIGIELGYFCLKSGVGTITVLNANGKHLYCTLWMGGFFYDMIRDGF